ncbi:glycoside hydrolase family 57 protein [Pyrobaculum neutrophilum]|uniref:Alpha-amylase n=1 Tax=Pyrobaculum neutrophilum (strain DSM 2338 / JCM 9278 / NBRC 100436 / V24Sta) TaxID=444157 RepID=B1Y907_PYRNV|nr:glycoside hydrolase family 57 protein [Pyrobaculum neutrophilum]ACB40236.1 Alpha-amylase [Pyrobaculum neutrophilum V24Sta]
MHVVLFLEVHQPRRIRPDLHRVYPRRPSDVEIFYDELNAAIFRRVSERVYRKATKIIYEAALETPGFKVTFSLSGLALEQFRRHAPDVLDLFRALASREAAEFTAQTYYHSLAWFIDREEFREQVEMQRKAVEELIGVRPRAAENTEFIYNNDIACFLHSMGFETVVTEGVDWVLGWRSPNYVYKAWGCDARVLVRNYRLSDDIGFRFGARWWDQWPLTADKYASWLDATPGDVAFIAVDYETFGEHHWPESGIHEFLRWLPREIAKRPRLRFATVSEAASLHPPRDTYDVPPWATISWADERDLSAWLGNEMQRSSFALLTWLYPYAKALGGETLKLWRELSTSDHFYYQATKTGPAGEVHSYFSPYGSAYKAHDVYMAALTALLVEIREKWSAEAAERLVFNDERCFHGHGARICSLKELRNTDAGFKKRHRQDLKRWLTDVFLLSPQEAERILG